MQNNTVRFRNLTGVLNRKQIQADLLMFREATGEDQRGFAQLAGINWGKVQRIESGQKTIDVADFESCLEAAGTTLMKYLNQLEIAESLKDLQEDWEITEMFIKALKLPEKRAMLIPILRGMFPEKKRPDKNRKPQRG